LSPEQIQREAQYHPAATWEAAYHEATRALVVREVLLFEADRLGLSESREPATEREGQAVIDELLERAVPVPQVSDAECERFFATQPERFVGPELFEASHILIACGREPVDRDAAQERAAGLLEELLERPRSFERLAREHSACQSASSGGRLGQLSPGETVPEFEAALRALEPGQLLTEPLLTEHGFHIVRLDNRSQGRGLPLAAVLTRVRVYLRERLWRAQLREFIETAAARADVVGFDLDSRSPVGSSGTSSHHSATAVASAPLDGGRRRLPLLQ
jgi:peptidyl-prolyl cis-trans isomerase C